MHRGDILETAKHATCSDRNETHGDCEANMAHTAAIWSAYLGVAITAIDVAHMLIQAKQSRTKHGNPWHADHYVDQCGYAAIAGQIATKNNIDPDPTKRGSY